MRVRLHGWPVHVQLGFDVAVRRPDTVLAPWEGRFDVVAAAPKSDGTLGEGRSTPTWSGETHANRQRPAVQANIHAYIRSRA